MDYSIVIEKLKISYSKTGSGENIICLHGWGQTKECFNQTIEFLSKDYCVYSIDLPGFGMSDEPLVSLDIYEYENIICKFIDELNIINPSFIAHSFGGRIAIIHFSKNKNVNKLIMTGGAGIKPKRSFKYKFSIINYKILKFLVKTPFYKHYKEDLYANSGSEDYKNASLILKQTLIKVVNEDLTYLLKKISSDTLLYWGSEDDFTPISDAYVMNKQINSCELIVADGLGHYAFLENINEFNKEISKFLKK